MSAHGTTGPTGRTPVRFTSTLPPRTVVLMPAGDRFEDFFDKIGVSLDRFRDEFTGGWLFNYVRALRLVAVRTVLLYMSARVTAATHFTHAESGASVWVLPSPRVHRKLGNAQARFFPVSPMLDAVRSYFATPLRAVTRVLRTERCDAMLCQDYEYARFDLCVLLGRFVNVPVFATFQGATETRTGLERRIRQLSMSQCRGLIIPSRQEVARVQSTYNVPLRRIGTIPNPVDVSDCAGTVKSITRTALGIPSSTRVVAWHGRVQVATKGLDVLIDAWNRICSERPDADILLLLVGTGRNADVLRQRIGSNRRIRWIDRYVISRQELWSYLLTADLYAIPSRKEGFAVAVLEAMACGLPVVGSDASGVADVFPRGEDDGGIVVPREDTDALAVALLRLLDDPELSERLGALGKRRIEKEFSLEAVGPQLRRFLFPGSDRDG